MNPEDQRIAIAEACGWKKTPDYDGLTHGGDGVMLETILSSWLLMMGLCVFMVCFTFLQLTE